MFDGMLNLLSYIGTMWLTKGELPKPPGSAHEYSVPWQAFEAKDGYLVVATRQEIFWKKLCEALERPDLADDPRYATNPEPGRETAPLWCRSSNDLPQPHRRRLDARLRAAEVPAAPVNNLDGAFAEPPVAEREMIVEYDHPKSARCGCPATRSRCRAWAGPSPIRRRAGRAHRQRSAGPVELVWG